MGERVLEEVKKDERRIGRSLKKVNGSGNEDKSVGFWHTLPKINTYSLNIVPWTAIQSSSLFFLKPFDRFFFLT